VVVSCRNLICLKNKKGDYMNCLNCKKEIETLKNELAKYKKLAVHDPLTGLYNRRQLELDLHRYLHLEDRYKINFLVVMIDVDGLKKVNKEQGHLGGDIMLKRVANTLKNKIRVFDKCYRLSGDEFILILRHSKTEDKHIIKRIRKELDKYSIKISVGGSKLCESALEISDKNMYKEKHRKKTNKEMRKMYEEKRKELRCKK